MSDSPNGSEPTPHSYLLRPNRARSSKNRERTGGKHTRFLLATNRAVDRTLPQIAIRLDRINFDTVQEEQETQEQPRYRETCPPIDLTIASDTEITNQSDLDQKNQSKKHSFNEYGHKFFESSDESYDSLSSSSPSSRSQIFVARTIIFRPENTNEMRKHSPECTFRTRTKNKSIIWPKGCGARFKNQWNTDNHVEKTMQIGIN